MDVTKNNFREVSAELDETINKADFITLDCEFTGLSTENNISPYDRIDEAYKKINDNSSGYILIQLGLTMIRVSDTDLNKFTYKSYNFYVFPNSWKNSFRCQGSSMVFLAENGFDFTKLFREGISYCSQQEEKVLRERLHEKQKYREDMKNKTEREVSNHIPVPDEEKESIERINNIAQEFLASSETEKVIGNCNGFQRKLVYEMLEEKFFDTITASTRTLNNDKVIVLERKKTAEEEAKIEEERRHNELLELEDSIGVSAVLQKISKSKKVIVGHNMLLDIIFILRQFFGPLPASLNEFKRYVHQIFPNIIDTKYMCTLPKVKEKIKSSVLSHLVQSLSDEPFSLPIMEAEKSDYAYSVDQSKAHEAGFDSYLTAIAFLGIAKYLHGSVKNIAQNINEGKQYVNRVYMMKIQDICYMNLVGNEPLPSRDHVFHVNVPETWKQADLINHFKNFGPIYITWINSTRAFVSLHNRENSSCVLKTIGKTPGFKVQSFAQFQASLEIRINEGNRIIIKKRKYSESHSSEETTPREKKQRKNSQNQETSKPLVKTFAEHDDWSS